MNTEKTFDIQKACAAQKKLQQDNGYPDFAPGSGSCYRCGKNIYTEMDKGNYKTGISVERAGSSLVTGCPHCNYSYCD